MSQSEDIRIGVYVRSDLKDFGVRAEALGRRHGQAQLPVCLAVKLIRTNKTRPALRPRRHGYALWPATLQCNRQLPYLLGSPEKHHISRDALIGRHLDDVPNLDVARGNSTLASAREPDILGPVHWTGDEDEIGQQ